MASCLRRGEAPYASHALYTQTGVLDDNVPEQRKLGIEAGYAWWDKADLIAFYLDLGWSHGMRAANERAGSSGKASEVRFIGLDWLYAKGKT